jgi:subtilase family serine protease
MAAGETCSNGSPAPCAEDIQISGCTACHSIRVTAGNRNGTDRVITGSSGTTRHIDDPLTSDWGSIVSAMQSKGALATSATTGYLNTNYCPGCTGPILGSPVQSAVTDSSATVSWSTSYNGFEDELTNTVLFYGTTEADVLACTNTAGCPGVSVVVQDSGTPVAHHAVNLTGLTSFTVYYLVNQATSASHGTTRSGYATSFRTRAFTGGGGVIIPKLYAYSFYDDSLYCQIDCETKFSYIIIIDPASDTVLGYFPAGSATGPGDMASHPDGTAAYYMADSSLKVIQTEDDTVPATLLGAGGSANLLAVSGNGQRLYLAYLDGGDSKVKIKVYNTTDPLSPTLVTTISNATLDSCSYPIGLVVQPDGGGHLFMACHSSPDQLIMVDTGTYAATQTATFATEGDAAGYNYMAVLPGGDQVYVVRNTYPSGTVEAFDGVTGASIGSVPLPSGTSAGLAVPSIEGSLLFAEDYLLGIHVIDTAGLTLLETMDPATSAGADIAINPNGSRLYSAYNTQIFVNDASDFTNITTISLYCTVNCYESAYQLTMTPGHSPGPVPDVVMTDVTPNAAAVAAGNTLSVTDTVSDQGTGGTETSFMIGYHLSTNTTYGDGDDIPIATTRVVGPLAAGVDDTATTDLLIPGATAPGTYYVCALADSTSALAESNADNNTLCSTATVVIARPDMVMTNVTPNASSVAPGGTLSTTDTVQNQGSAPNGGPFTIGYSLSPDTTYGNGDDIAITTTRTVGVLAASASSTATTNLLIPLSTPPGTYHVCAKADAGNTVSETNESNNSLCSTLTVGPAIADLVMSAVSTAATAAAPGGSVTLSNSAKNQGTGSAGSFVVAFHLSTDTTYGNGDDIAITTTRTVASLAVGATSTASSSLAVPAATPLGTYYLCAKADSGSTVSEGDETNNTRCTTGTIQVTRPDLIMTAVTPNSATVSTAGTLSVTNSAKNQGAVSAGSSIVAYRLSVNTTYGDGDDIAITTTRTITSLAAGATSTASTTLTIPNTTAPGNYYVCAKSDSAGTVTELDETNNALCNTTDPVSVPQSDLTMTAASTTATVLAPGGSFNLSNTAKNQGLFPAGSFTVAFHLSTDNIYGGGDDIAFTATRTVSSLAVLATSVATTSLTIPAATPGGTYYVCAMADSAGTVSESDESNNSLCTTTTVQVSGPDLIMTSVTPNASTVNQGAMLSVTDTTQNQGGVPSGATIKIGYRLSVNTTYGDGDDVAITTTRSVTTLAAGASSTATTSLAIPATTPPATYHVCAMTDSLAQVAESNETNNTLCSTGTVTVPPVDLIMSAASTTATTLAAGANFTLSNTAKNQGGSSAGTFTVAFHLSTDTTYGNGDDVVITQTRVVSMLAIGGTSTASTTLTVPASTTPGPYYVCATADSGNTVPEGDETNNSLCTGTPIQVSGPDLIMTAVTPNSGTVNQGATLSVTNTAQNQGLLSAGSFRVAFRLSLNTTYGDGDDVAITATRSVTSLAAGANSTGTTSLTVPTTTPPGNYYVCAMADSLSAVSELDEANNTLCSAGTVSVPQPDLVMTVTSTTATIVAAGANFTLSNTAKNQGGSSAGSFTIAYHLSTDTTYGNGDDVVITQTRSVTSLGINATSAASTTLTVPASTPTGSYYVCSNADDAGTVAEGDETNNSRCTTAPINVP